MSYPKAEGTLYNPRFEHDSCGVGFVADISGEKSRRVLDRALEAVVNVTHRGAVSADAKTGDGAGVLTQIPSSIFVPQAAALGATVANDGDLAVGVVFLPQDGAAQARRTLKGALHDCGLTVLGWRETPIDASIIGDQALASLPRIEHVLVTWPDAPSNEAFTSRLFLARKIAERRLAAEESACYIASLSNRLIVYKGMLVAPQLQTFYKDLDSPEYETALAVLHQRYSTNTFPSWERSQPFRMLGHNGEINTVDGNRNRIRAREIHAAVWADAAADLLPILQEDLSDSASLDNVLELLVLSGRDPLHAMAMLIPEAWENMPYMDPVLRAFYEYHACLTEPWDGPAAVAFTDGTVAAAVLDRNGLRPARYKIDDDNIFVMASEVGATYMDDAHVIEKGRLGPGQMIAVDTEQKALLRNDEIKARLARRQPYGDWLSRKMVTVDSLKADADSVPATRATIPVQRAFAYTSEEAHLVLRPLYLDGVEPVGSLGDDTPLSILAHKPRQLYTYFRQRFAQATNPPIDSYREQLVMSLYTYLGVRGSLLEETEEHAAQLRLASPILTDAQLAAIKGADSPLHTETISVLFPVAEGTEGLKRVLDEVCAAAASAADAGSTTLILSDRNDNPGDIILDDELLPLLQDAIALKGPVKLEYQIRNVHRTAGARIAGEIARIHGDDGIPDHSIEIRFTGSAGQSFGAFLIHGMHLLLDGEANDYVGKGMHGGELVVRPPAEAQFHRMTTSSSAIRCSMAQREARCLPPGARGSASACGTRAHGQSSRGRAITPAST